MSRGRKPNPERDARIRVLLESGMTLQEAADVVGVTRNRVWQVAQRDGIALKRGPRRKGTSPRTLRRHQMRQEMLAHAARFAASPEAQRITEAKKAYWSRSA